MSFARLIAPIFVLLLSLAATGRLVAQESSEQTANAAADNTADSSTDASNGDTEQGADSSIAPQPASPGQPDLDEATRLKLTATDGREIGRVIDLLNSAIKKGLDKENEAFAKQMLASTYMERGAAVGAIALEQAVAQPSRTAGWTQLRAIALADLRKAVELDPAEYDGWIMIGQLNLLPQGDLEAAENAFTQVIDGKEVDDELRAKAHIRRAVMRDDQAAKLADLTGAVEADPDNVEYRLLRARQHFATEAYKESLADVDEALQMVPDNYATHELRGLVLLALDRAEDALAAFDQATELNAKAVTPYLRRAELYGRLGDMQRGIDQASKAIELNNDSPLGYLLRSDLYLRNNQAEKALADADKALESTPGLVQAYWMKARVFDELGRTADAMDQLQELADGLPPQVELNLQIAIYALQLEMPRRAIAALDRAINVDPENAMLYRFRGDSNLNIGQHRAAIDNYEKALELDPEDSGLLNNFAWTLATSPDAEVRDGKRALELATEACELTDYNTAHILSTLAAAYAEAGDFETAKKWAQKAVDLNDEDNGPQIAEELASYERGQPVRESQMLDSGERDDAESLADNSDSKPSDELEKTQSSTPAPRRSIDF